MSSRRSYGPGPSLLCESVPTKALVLNGLATFRVSAAGSYPETVVGNVNGSFLHLSTESPIFPYLKKPINIGKMKLGHSFH